MFATFCHDTIMTPMDGQFNVEYVFSSTSNTCSRLIQHRIRLGVVLCFTVLHHVSRQCSVPSFRRSISHDLL